MNRYHVLLFLFGEANNILAAGDRSQCTSNQIYLYQASVTSIDVNTSPHGISRQPKLGRACFLISANIQEIHQSNSR